MIATVQQHILQQQQQIGSRREREALAEVPSIL
jgi:hypothetical protein